MGDDEPPIFEIRENHLDSGLRGIPVGTCQTSFVDPIKGVHYVGYPVEDLVNMEEEDVIGSPDEGGLAGDEDDEPPEVADPSAGRGWGGAADLLGGAGAAPACDA